MTMKIRLADFSTFTRSVTLEDSTNFCDSIYDNISRLYDNFDKGAKKVRLVGVRASGLCPSGLQDNLFGGLAEKKREDIHRALDRIRDKFGGAAIFRAGSKDTD
jgi:DNA polymerase-4